MTVASTTTPIRPSEARVLELLQGAPSGVTMEEIGTAYGDNTRWILRNCMARLRRHGHTVSKVKAGRKGYKDTWLYFFTEPRTVEPSIPSVTRKVSGDLGLGATPGTIVSVPWISILDAEAAAQGGGAA